MSQAALTRITYTKGQYNILRSFIAVTGLSPSHLSPLLHPTSNAHVQRRQWSHRSRNSLEHSHPAGWIRPEVEETHTAGQLSSKVEVLAEQENQPEPTSTFVPWYLQLPSSKLSKTTKGPLNERQQIPDLPPNPPPVLSPLLHHLFDGAGLDDLAIVDLRHLDPPPALGSNLLMIIGTARSIKHLNVSADRLCRWLRSEYKLRPKADGLLGRNELKVRLRRRAKRAKLASAVGRQLDDTNRDDGITTGWICVNVGPVPGPDGQDSTEVTIEEEEGGGFIGFGARDKGPRIVVQMLTEEKRAELDLEGLWNHRTLKQGDRDERRVEEIEAEITQDLGKAFETLPANEMADTDSTSAESRDQRPVG